MATSEPSIETLLARAYHESVDLHARIDRTLDYADQLLELDNLGSDLRVVLQAVRSSLTTPGKGSS